MVPSAEPLTAGGSQASPQWADRLNRQYAFSPRPLGELLVSAELINRDQLLIALSEQKEQVGKHRRLGEILQQHGWVKEVDITRTLCEHFGILYVDLRHVDIDPRTISLIPANFARSHNVIPLRLEGDRLQVVVPDPTDYETFEILRFLVGYVLEIAVAPAEEIARAVAHYYGSEDAASALAELEISGEAKDNVDVKQAEKSANEKPIVQLVHNIMVDAVARHASDIHIRPCEKEAILFFRVDGALQKIRTLAKGLLAPVVSRIKILGGMDISERRLPQDGRTQVSFLGKKVDLRLSIIPGIYGESVVIRLLDTQFALGHLQDLGFVDADAVRIKHMLTQSHGLFLVTGPTGSGKSTTLYTALEQIRSPQVNIVTVEDPVEYHLDGITQIQVNSATGYTFSRALRHILRHDPDVIMVGEIRDEETAKMAVESALTGHLVLSTLHTNSAGATIARLLEIGVAPYLVSSVLLGVLAQRLTRKICKHCKTPQDVDVEVRELMGVAPEEVFYAGKGCDQCYGTGVKGRMAVYELMTLSRGIRDAISKHASADEVYEVAVREGMTPLTQNALQAARAGKISLMEAYRVRLQT
ncbi:Type II secretory pathway protein [gamma proteobacterium HdN1]|nr:Type II secretory pathway protein [gamma proteobacterium HdN1]